MRGYGCPHTLCQSAARLLKGPESYNRKHAAALADGTATYVTDKLAQAFSVTGLLERAASGTEARLTAAKRKALADAKALLCLHLHAVHLDWWESRQKPSWQDVKALLTSPEFGAP
jgi:hypothetical protein